MNSKSEKSRRRQEKSADKADDRSKRGSIVREGGKINQTFQEFER